MPREIDREEGEGAESFWVVGSLRGWLLVDVASDPCFWVPFRSTIRSRKRLLRRCDSREGKQGCHYDYLPIGHPETKTCRFRYAYTVGHLQVAAKHNPAGTNCLFVRHRADTGRQRSMATNSFRLRKGGIPASGIGQDFSTKLATVYERDLGFGICK